MKEIILKELKELKELKTFYNSNDNGFDFIKQIISNVKKEKSNIYNFSNKENYILKLYIETFENIYFRFLIDFNLKNFQIIKQTENYICFCFETETVISKELLSSTFDIPEISIYKKTIDNFYFIVFEF